MKTLKIHLILITLFVMLANQANGASSSDNPFSKPDFAFPQTIADRSYSQLEKAIKTDDGKTALRAVINYGLAESSINGDSIQNVLRVIADITPQQQDPAVKGMLYMLRAEIYKQLYFMRRYIYDERELPTSILPADMLDLSDYTLWDKATFQSVITALVDKALSEPNALKSSPLEKWDGVITYQEAALPIFPTLYEFMAYKAIDLISSLAPVASTLNVGWLSPFMIYNQSMLNALSPEVRKILSVYNSLVASSPNRDAELYSILQRTLWINRHVYYIDNNAPNALRNACMELYDRYSDSPFSAEALIAIGGYNAIEMSDSVKTRYVNDIDRALMLHPEYFRANTLRNIRNRLLQAVVRVKFPSTCYPAIPIKVLVNNTNATDYTVTIYRLPENIKDENYYRGDLSSLTGIMIHRVYTPEAQTPFTRIDSFEVKLPTTGLYIAVPMVKGADTKSRQYHNIIRCTTLQLQSLEYGAQKGVYVIDPMTGAPVKGARISSTCNDKIKRYGHTDRNGFSKIDEDCNEIRATLGKDRFAYPISIYSYWKEDNNTRYLPSVYTDLAIYHPGDTVQWAAVLQKYNGRNACVAASIKCSIELSDVNNEPLDTIDAVTDEWGRIQGIFKLPAEGLSGYHSISVTPDHNITSSPDISIQSGNRAFMVTDYKMPSYHIDITNIDRDKPCKGDVTLKGKIETYSGFPLAETSITVNLQAVQRTFWWWMRGTNITFHTVQTVTDKNGEFSIEFANSVLEASPIPGGLFQADITATSSSGENQTATTSFNTGRPYLLGVNINHNLDTSLPIKAEISLATPSGQKAPDSIINYTIMSRNDSTIVAHGSTSSDNGKLDLKDVRPGEYWITFAPADTTLANPTDPINIILYNPQVNLCPVNTDIPIWTPDHNITINGKHVSVLYATSNSSTWVHYIVMADTTMLDQGWINEKAGIHNFDYNLPKNVDKIKIMLAATNNMNASNELIRVATLRSRPQLHMTIESFRDHIIPGTEETWTIRITDRDSSGIRSAIMLDMYAAALEKLASQQLSIQTLRNRHAPFDLYVRGGFGHETIVNSSRLNMLKETAVDMPGFQTWGIRVGSGYVARMLMGRAAGIAMSESAEEENLVFTASDAAPMGLSSKKKMATTDTIADNDAGTDESTESSQSQSNIDYRRSEVPLAFFEPMLTTESDGSLKFTFTAPNANTTWRLLGMAYDENMTSTTISRDIISSKPVMVRPNLPRFMRQGDKAIIIGLVMNNTDSAAHINSTVEIFDPATDDIIQTEHYILDLDANSSGTVSTEVYAPSDKVALGYRIKAVSGNYSDGEQAMIPILPASEPIIETRPFYLGAEQHQLQFTLPTMPEDARVTLQFCENPVWYVVTALPGLRKNSPDNALEASASIFSAAIAQDLLTREPAIADAIKEWTESDRSDSILTSMLERNSDLKTILLNSTPWVMDARSQTERMTRLALLFDKSEIEQAYTGSFNMLAKLQNTDGGLKWMSQINESSLWITENFIASMGRLNQLGMLPRSAQLSSIIRKAVSYYDNYYALGYEKNPSLRPMTYVMVRDYFPEYHLSDKLSRLVELTVEHIASNWKKMDLANKGIAAMILDRHNRKELAATILESITQYSVYSPEKGRWWPTFDNMTMWSMGSIGATSILLDAYTLTTKGMSPNPYSEIIDQVRQWLVLQREAKDWGTSVTTSDVIASMLLCGSDWIKPAQGAEIRIGKKTIDQGNVGRLTGYFRENISSYNPSGSLINILKPGDTPSWGAIYCQFTQDMQSIKAAACDDLSIMKQWFVRRDTPNGTTWIETDSLHVGDIVQINLTLKASRAMDYVAIIDDRAAAFEPQEQTPAPIWAEGICFYRENSNATTRIYVTHLPKGTYRLSYMMYVNNAGQFASGIASAQSQYAPALSAHSGGTAITVLP